MLFWKILLLFTALVLAMLLLVLNFEWHTEYSEVNRLESRLTLEVRHPQHISHSRYLIRTNIISGYKCIAKIEGLARASDSKMGMALCSEVEWWEIYK